MSILTGLFQALGIIGIVGIIVGIPVSIILFIVAAKKEDEEKKKSLKKRAKWFILLPIILTIGSLIITSILGAISAVK